MDKGEVDRVLQMAVLLGSSLDLSGDVSPELQLNDIHSSWPILSPCYSLLAGDLLKKANR